VDKWKEGSDSPFRLKRSIGSFYL